MKARCKYCGRLMYRAPQALAENPFCSNCLEARQRVALAARFGAHIKSSDLVFEEDGEYTLVKAPETKLT